MRVRPVCVCVCGARVGGPAPHMHHMPRPRAAPREVARPTLGAAVKAWAALHSPADRNRGSSTDAFRTVPANSDLITKMARLASRVAIVREVCERHSSCVGARRWAPSGKRGRTATGSFEKQGAGADALEDNPGRG